MDGTVKDAYMKLEVELVMVAEREEKYIIQYRRDGDSFWVKPTYVRHPELVSGSVQQDESVLGKVYINETQYFDNVPELAWNFYIGGYQPAQKWLKDRKGRTLEFDDILHYQKIIVALTKTSLVMGEIDKNMEGLV